MVSESMGNLFSYRRQPLTEEQQICIKSDTKPSQISFMVDEVTVENGIPYYLLAILLPIFKLSLNISSTINLPIESL